MTAGARTPEELETLLEDAVVLRDREAATALFETDAVVHGDLWQRTYVADPRHVLQLRDTALVVSDGHIGVVRRGRDGAWRYAISLSTTQRRDDMTTETHPLDPYAVRSDEGDARWWFGALAVIKATGADTGGQFTIVEVTEPPGAEAPLHVHHREDEAFWILEGSATLEIGDRTIEARAGDYAFGPRGIPHRYTIGSERCRMLFICTPAGFENLVREMSTPAEGRTLPAPNNEEPDWEHVAAVAKANQCELLA